MEPNLLIVTVAATITALATGLGVLPFLVRRPGLRALSDANAAAAGVMLAAAVALAIEGVNSGVVRTVAGVALGAALILVVRARLPEPSALRFEGLRGDGAEKAVLIVAVMTAHSAAEGIAVGVSFGEGATFGAALTIAIAIHNIPEGLAIGLVLIPRGVGVGRAALWSIFSSLPQPILALPAFLFVEAFSQFLPIGLGLAAGAMAWMVVAELAPEALRNASVVRVATVGGLSFAAMTIFQALLIA